MATIVNAKFKQKRGTEASIPVLLEGELYICTDSNKLYVGSASGNQLICDISQLNNKENKYDGGITDLNLALTHGKYTFGNTAINGFKNWYGELEVIVNNGGTHNNDNWIWQFAYYTDGTIATRCKANADNWTEWSLLSQSIKKELTLLNGWVKNDDDSPAYVVKNGNNITVLMHIKGGSLTNGTVICNIGYTSPHYFNYPVYIWNGEQKGTVTLNKVGDINVTSVSSNEDLFIAINYICE